MLDKLLTDVGDDVFGGLLAVPVADTLKRANAEGRPYLLDVHVEPHGVGATSTWHPAFSVADL